MLLTEAVNIQDIRTAINNKNIVELEYDTGDGQATGPRQVEIHAIGYNVSGKVVLDAYQIRGTTKTEVPEWKTFDIKNIKNFKILNKTFNRPREKWAEQGNQKVLKVLLQVKF